jgi:hypothetical protein
MAKIKSISGLSDNEEKLLVNAGLIAVGYFGIVKPLLNKLGITDSPEVKQAKAENNAASNLTAWSPAFYKAYTGTKHLYTDAYITTLAGKIYNAWGVFNDDEEAIYGVFRQLKNQLQLSQLADKYFTLYNQDLLQRLKNPWYYGKDGLDDEQFNVIAQIVNKLPVNAI